MRVPRLVILVTSAFLLAAVPSADGCASNHIGAKLGAFSEGSLSLPLYWVEESAGQATITLLILDASCDGSPSSVTWEVQPGSAGTPADFSPATTPFQWFNTVGHPPSQDRQVGITNDALGVPPLEGGVETAKVVLTGGENVRLDPPTSAPLVILDDDGATPSFSLVDGSYEESESSPSGGVPVFRGGAASGTSTVDFTVGGGSAVRGSDYTADATGTITFGPGERMKLIPITIHDDAEQEPKETFIVSISGPGVTGTSTVPFAITDNEEGLAPTSTLHHPNQAKRYRPSMYLIREIHIFTADEGGAGVVAAEFALRRNMKKGACAWWAGRRFKKGKCEAERWLKTEQYETDFFFIRLPELPPSTGKVRNYTAFSRAIDGAGNVEEQLEQGRNANTFEIRKP